MKHGNEAQVEYVNNLCRTYTEATGVQAVKESLWTTDHCMMFEIRLDQRIKDESDIMCESCSESSQKY